MIFDALRIHVQAGFVKKEFLFAIFSSKVKIHIVISQIALLVWACLSLAIFIFIRTR